MTRDSHRALGSHGIDAWWHDRNRLRRVVCDHLTAEIARLRPGDGIPVPPWDPHLPLGKDGLSWDSIEMLSLATASSEVFRSRGAPVGREFLAVGTFGDWVEAVARRLATRPSEMGFRTSGSTGEPQLHLHAMDGLGQEIAALAELLPRRRRVLSAVPSHHIYGFLFSVLLPHYFDVPVIDVRGTSGDGLAATLQAGDLIVGHPFFWDAFSRSVTTVPADAVGVTSSAPCPPEVAARAGETGLARLVQVYGSTETAGIGWRDTGAGDYRLFPFWRRAGDDGSLLRLRGDGATELRDIPDQLAWSGATTFRIVGRRDDAVQVAGRNVYASRVQAHLRGHPAVRDAAVRLMRPDEGVRLKAFVVPCDPVTDPGRLRAELRAWCEAHLLVAERPRAFTFGSDLPHGSMGKAGDWTITDTV